MFHRMRARHLNVAAAGQLARGNVGAAAMLHGRAMRQRFIGRHCRVFWNPWMAGNWLIRRSIRRSMVAMTCTIALAASIPLHETVVVMNQEKQLVVVPEEANFKPCSQHTLVDLPEIIEVTFEQEGKNTVLYADRKCSKCGQHFFCYPSDEPPPYTVPVAPTQAQAAPAPTPAPVKAQAPAPAQEAQPIRAQVSVSVMTPAHQQAPAPSPIPAPTNAQMPPVSASPITTTTTTVGPPPPIPVGAGCGFLPYPSEPNSGAAVPGYPMMPMPGIGFNYPPPSPTPGGP